MHFKIKSGNMWFWLTIVCILNKADEGEINAPKLKPRTSLWFMWWIACREPSKCWNKRIILCLTYSAQAELLGYFLFFSLVYNSTITKQYWNKLLKKKTKQKTHFCWKLLLKYVCGNVLFSHRISFLKSVINVTVCLPTTIVLTGKMEPEMYKHFKVIAEI